jgi:hypothetical protein
MFNLHFTDIQQFRKATGLNLTANHGDSMAETKVIAPAFHRPVQSARMKQGLTQRRTVRAENTEAQQEDSRASIVWRRIRLLQSSWYARE